MPDRTVTCDRNANKDKGKPQNVAHDIVHTGQNRTILHENVDKGSHNEQSKTQKQVIDKAHGYSHEDTKLDKLTGSDETHEKEQNKDDTQPHESGHVAVYLGDCEGNIFRGSSVYWLIETSGHNSLVVRCDLLSVY